MRPRQHNQKGIQSDFFRVNRSLDIKSHMCSVVRLDRHITSLTVETTSYMKASPHSSLRARNRRMASKPYDCVCSSRHILRDSDASGRADGSWAVIASIKGARSSTFAYFWVHQLSNKISRTRKAAHVIQLLAKHVADNEDIQLEWIVRNVRRQLWYFLISAFAIYDELGRCTGRYVDRNADIYK